MSRIFIGPLWGAIFCCVGVVPVGAQGEKPTPAPTEATSPKAQTNERDAADVPNGYRANRGSTRDLPSDVRAEGERRIAARPEYPEATWRPPAVDSVPPLTIPVVSRAEDLKNRADALVLQGYFSKAIALYDEALRISPRSADIYRGRAIALLHLGDRVQTQNDYRRFLDLDPQAQDRVQQEFRLFEQSTPGTSLLAGSASWRDVSYGAPPYPFTDSLNHMMAVPAVSVNNIVPDIQDWRLAPIYRSTSSTGDYLAAAADQFFAIARNAFSNGDYPIAYQWTQRAESYLPQARTRALAAQVLMAQRMYGAAAAEARAAVTMGPLLDSTALYGYYGFDVARYRRQFQALQDYVRENPSVAEARFLLGYQHRILDQKEAAHAQLAIASVLDPLDTVAKELLARDGVEVVGANEAAVNDMMAREGVRGSVRVSRVPPPPAPPGATDEPVKR